MSESKTPWPDRGIKLVSVTLRQRVNSQKLIGASQATTLEAVRGQVPQLNLQIEFGWMDKVTPKRADRQ
jgi:hypothetical protein